MSGVYPGGWLMSEHVVARDDEGEVLVIRFDDGSYHLARRGGSGDSWGPPLEVVRVECDPGEGGS